MRRLLIVAILPLVFLACRREVDESRTGPAHTSTTTVNPQEVPGNSTAMNPVIPPAKTPGSRSGPIATQRIEVSLDDFEIRMPDTIAAGPQLLHIIDVGKQNHSFAITGNGVAMQLSSELTRGDASDLAINLKPGTYTVYCPVDDHKGKGMTRTITVK